MKNILPLIASLLLISACKNNEPNDSETTTNTNAIPAPQIIANTVVGMHPHDTSYFTEGLQLYDNTLYESTGTYGNSKLLKINPKTGEVEKELKLPDNYFGEGITVLRDTIYMMTYQEKTGFKYDANTFKQIGTFSYDNEGWGMTTDGTNLIQSDGSSNLYYRDPATFRTQKIVSVTDQNGPVAMINELEWVDGFIYANVWHTNYIIKIDPSNGRVVAKTDLSAIADQVVRENPNIDQESVLNGIAYNEEKKTFYVTGKRWPAIYEIKLQ
jgi:glutaminyl-peptide cyclotransferase